MLVNNIEILKKYIPTIVTGTFNKYTQYMSDANTWVRREILGSELYEVIKELSSIDETPTHADLVTRSEAVIAFKGYIEAIPMLDLIETESGFGIVRTDKIAPASPERVKALIAGIQSKLSDAIEELIDYLEETESYHDEWKGSPAYSLLSDTYIETLKQFRTYAPFEGNRIDFVRFKPKLLQAINLKICPVISEDLSDQIIEQLRDEDLTTENKSILENLRFALALFATGEDKTANSFLMRVRKVILTTPDNFPAFKNSALYASILAQTSTDNSGSIFKGAL